MSFLDINHDGFAVMSDIVGQILFSHTGQSKFTPRMMAGFEFANNEACAAGVFDH